MPSQNHNVQTIEAFRDAAVKAATSRPSKVQGGSVGDGNSNSTDQTANSTSVLTTGTDTMTMRSGPTASTPPSAPTNDAKALDVSGALGTIGMLAGLTAGLLGI